MEASQTRRDPRVGILRGVGRTHDLIERIDVAVIPLGRPRRPNCVLEIEHVEHDFFLWSYPMVS